MASTLSAGQAILQDGTTTGDGKIFLIGGACLTLSVAIIGSAGVASGAVQLEECWVDKDNPVYTATWSAIGSPVTVVATTQTVVHAQGSFWAVRARISTTIGSGTVKVVAWAS